MRNRIALGSFLAFALAGPALAADGFSYNNIELGYVSTEVDDFDVEGDGLMVSGAMEFNERVFGFASLNDIDYDGGLDSTTFTLGAGFNFPLSSTLDLVSGVSYEHLKLEIEEAGSANEDGFGLNVGLRGRVGTSFELTGGVKYTDFGHDVDDFTLTAGARYYFTPAFAAGIDASDNDDGTSWVVAVRYDFGNRY